MTFRVGPWTVWFPPHTDSNACWGLFRTADSLFRWDWKRLCGFEALKLHSPYAASDSQGESLAAYAQTSRTKLEQNWNRTGAVIFVSPNIRHFLEYNPQYTIGVTVLEPKIQIKLINFIFYFFCWGVNSTSAMNPPFRITNSKSQSQNLLNPPPGLDTSDVYHMLYVDW